MLKHPAFCCCCCCCCCTVIVKASSGPRYVVGCRNKVDKAKLTTGTRVALDMTTLTIMRALPREVCIRCAWDGWAAGGLGSV
jgi:ATP-dependent 26S proteasome regulatory subunit